MASSSSDPYAGTPLSKKLGIKPDSVVALMQAPTEVAALLEAQSGADFHHEPTRECSLAVWFLRSQAELAAALERIVDQAERDPVWLAWPKKAGSIPSD